MYNNICPVMKMLVQLPEIFMLSIGVEFWMMLVKNNL